MAHLSTESIGRVRALTMGATGVVCLIYGSLALATGRPDPVNAFIPGVFGVASAIAIFIAFWMGNSKSAKGAKDELFQMENARALGIGYWAAILMYPVFAVFLAKGVIPYPVAFAAMGTLSGAAYLIPFAIFTGRN